MIPIYCKPSIENFSFFSSRIPGGFPSPADDYLEGRLSLDELLIEHPASTFFAKIEGDSMMKAGIAPGDIAVIDRSLDARHNDIILAWLDGGYTVKRLIKKEGKVYLYPESNKYTPLEITEVMEARIWGVVICIIKKFR